MVHQKLFARNMSVSQQQPAFVLNHMQEHRSPQGPPNPLRGSAKLKLQLSLIAVKGTLSRMVTPAPNQSTPQVLEQKLTR